MNNSKFVFEYLDFLFPNPKCELNYSKDYELLIAVVLSAQTTDKKVNEVTNILFTRFDTLEKLNNASIEEIKEIIMPIGTFNKKSEYIKDITRELIEKYNSSVPKNFEQLQSIKGVGHKTASVVLGVLYNVPAFAVDTHVSRVSKRLGFTVEKDSVDVIEKKLKKIVPQEQWIKRHHQLVLFGRYNCKSRNPICDDCKLKNICKEYKK